MAGYDEYLTAAVKTIENLKPPVKAIHLSGGMLDENGLTECQTVKPELEKRLRECGITTPIITDEESLTTISIAKKFVSTYLHQYPAYKPLLFTDEVRAEVNRYAVGYFLKQAGESIESVDDMVVPLPRHDTHPHSTIEFQRKKLEEMKKRGIEEVDKVTFEKRLADKEAKLKIDRTK